MTHDFITNKKRVYNMLIAGRKLTKRGLDRMLDVTNSAEIIRSLRHDDNVPIKTIWKKSEAGKRYGEYVYDPPLKVSKITSGAYKESWPAEVPTL